MAKPFNHQTTWQNGITHYKLYWVVDGMVLTGGVIEGRKTQNQKAKKPNGFLPFSILTYTPPKLSKLIYYLSIQLIPR